MLYWGSSPYSVFVNEMQECYDNKLLPIHDNIWKKFGVLKGRSLISDIVFDTTDPDYLFSTNDHHFGSEDSGIFVSTRIRNTSGKDIVVSGPHNTLMTGRSTGDNRGIKLDVTLKISNVFNIESVDTDWDNIPLSITKLIEAMAAMHIAYLQTNKSVCYSKCSMNLCYSINLEYFLNKNPHRILYIEPLGLKIGYKGCNLKSNQEWVEKLKNKLDPDLWFDVISPSWEYAYVVDNTASIPPVWGMVAGQYAQVGKQVGLNRPDGLYIVTGERFEDDNKHIFIPVDQLEHGGAEQYGYGFRKEDVNSGKSHREYSALRDKHEKLVADADALKCQNADLENEVKELRGENDKLTKIKDEVEKLRAKDIARDIELSRLKAQVDSAKQETKEQSEKAKQDIKDTKEEKVFRIIGVVLGFLGAVLSLFTGIKKLKT